MMNLREAIEYLVELGIEKEKVINIDGDNYTDLKELRRIDDNVVLDYLRLTTLTGFVDYIKSNFDKVYKENLLVVVESPTRVTLSIELNSDGRRNKIAMATALTPDIAFNTFYNTEQFNILLQSAFLSNKEITHKEILLKVVGNIKEEVIKNTGDDGISQAATIRTGIATVQDVKVPNPVMLRPYRTFPEVEQPESKFVFRMKDGPACALYEADGGAWRNEAMRNIKKYLETELEGVEGLTIIS